MLLLIRMPKKWVAVGNAPARLMEGSATAPGIIVVTNINDAPQPSDHLFIDRQCKCEYSGRKCACLDVFMNNC